MLKLLFNKASDYIKKKSSCFLARIPLAVMTLVPEVILARRKLTMMPSSKG